MSNHILERVLRIAIKSYNLGSLKYGNDELQVKSQSTDEELSSLTLSKLIDKATKLNLLSKKEVEWLKTCANKLRNPWSHGNYAQIIDRSITNVGANTGYLFSFKDAAEAMKKGEEIPSKSVKPTSSTIAQIMLPEIASTNAVPYIKNILRLMMNIEQRLKEYKRTL